MRTRIANEHFPRPSVGLSRRQPKHFLDEAWIAEFEECWRKMSVNSSRRPRLVLADDCDLMLSFVADVLRRDFEIVASVRGGYEAIEAVVRFNPDVIVLDIEMPGLSGIQTAQRLKEHGTVTKIVFLTGYEDPGFVASAVAANASGFVFKPRLLYDLPCAIREALAGRFFLSSSKVT
jgi:DNA-binding NarL/FixJ family response regulator